MNYIGMGLSIVSLFAPIYMLTFWLPRQLSVFRDENIRMSESLQALSSMGGFIGSFGFILIPLCIASIVSVYFIFGKAKSATSWILTASIGFLFLGIALFCYVSVVTQLSQIQKTLQ